LTVRVELPEPFTEVGLKLAVAPVGTPVTLKLTLELNPPREPMVTTYLILLVAGPADCEPGEAEIVKSLAFMVSDTGVECVWPLLAFPTMLSG